MKLIDGKQIAEVIKEEIKAEVAKYIDDYDVVSRYGIIGNNIMLSAFVTRLGRTVSSSSHG